MNLTSGLFLSFLELLICFVIYSFIVVLTIVFRPISITFIWLNTACENDAIYDCPIINIIFFLLQLAICVLFYPIVFFINIYWYAKEQIDEFKN